MNDCDQKRRRWRVLMGLGISVIAGMCGLVFWVLGDADRREFVRTVLINFKGGEANQYKARGGR